eukprot:TRINITY_DN75954_c0_g1_i1.p1 TRINITY_DN75954_c0_g1~~TRINITY_DN75954_c0_g1_i1.p1  ORF type:complete len:302 (+),score=18.70 TRINITY_DN75954_c0_g1_i1:46-906(+)
MGIVPIFRFLYGSFVILISFGPVLSQRNFYDILGVSRDASQGSIKKAYKRKAMEWHPDKNRAHDAQERFREIAAAYEVLSDPNRRREYDNPTPDFEFDFGGFHFTDPNELFKDFFGGGDPFKMFNDVFAGVDSMFGEIDVNHVFEETGNAQRGIFDSFFDIGFGDAFFGGTNSPGNPHMEVFGSPSPDGYGQHETIGEGDGCSAEFAVGEEPGDTHVDHVSGSACCNALPQSSPTGRAGCCQRCVQSQSCQLFVWQPSVGSCWLLRWKDGASRVTIRTSDRITGIL